jgi:nucleotidyltransferase/DNA polymerase involved in DNA repair
MLACVLLPRVEAAADAGLTRRLLQVSPTVERAGDVAFLDDSGLQRLHGGPAGLFAAIRAALAPHAARNMALAGNRFTAEVAARFLRRPVTVRAGEEAAFLASLPLSGLPLSPALARRLLPLGLQRLGDFASLPVAAVERRYGAEGVALHRLARGEDRRGLLPERERREPAVLSVLEAPVDRLDRLRPALEAALERLCGWLSEDGEGVTRLQLRLSLDRALPDDDVPAAPAAEFAAAAAAGVEPVARRELLLSAPEQRAPLLLDLLALRLEAEPPGAAVTALCVEALQTAPLAVHQNALFGEVSRDAARRAEALARLQTLFGKGAVARPRLRAAHRLEERWTGAGASAPPHAPAAAVPARAAAAPAQGVAAPPEGPPASPALRVLPAPEEIVPRLVGGQLAGFRRGAREYAAVQLFGPRRLCGGWWREPWARDEYELATEDGGLYRVCRDGVRHRWLLLAETD